MSDQTTNQEGSTGTPDAGATGGSPQGNPETEGTSEQDQTQRDPNALPTPDEKYANAEADRQRLAEEHGQA